MVQPTLVQDGHLDIVLHIAVTVKLPRPLPYIGRKLSMLSMQHAIGLMRIRNCLLLLLYCERFLSAVFEMNFSLSDRVILLNSSLPAMFLCHNVCCNQPSVALQVLFQ